MRKYKERYRYSTILLRQLVKTDFKIRYQGSALGYIWSLLRPFLLFITLYFVFAKFLKVGNQVPHYPVYLLLGIVLWNFFTEVTAGSVSSIVGKGDLLRKINFPKYVIIISISISALINLALNGVIIAIFMVAGHVSISWSSLAIIPLIVELYIAALAMAFLLSAAFVRYRDVSYVWEVILQAAFYATPILYPLTRVPHAIGRILILNPMAQIIQDARYSLVSHQTITISNVYGGDYYIWFIPIGLTLIILILSSAYFRSRSKSFAEEA